MRPLQVWLKSCLPLGLDEEGGTALGKVAGGLASVWPRGQAVGCRSLTPHGPLKEAIQPSGRKAGDRERAGRMVFPPMNGGGERAG